MAEEELAGTTEVEDAEDAELEASEIVTDDKGNKTVSLSTMLRYKKEAKANAKRIKELEPVAARVTDLEGKLEGASPIINAILSNPKLKAEALRVVNGTRTSSEHTDQPDNDPDAEQFAEDSGFYLADGSTVDVARARRVLDRLDQRHGRQTDAKLRPVVGQVVGRSATENVRQILAMTDADGVPMATKESIDEVLQRLRQNGGEPLLANPDVMDMVIDQAAGLDRRKGRTPKMPDEPLYLASAGGSRRRAEPTLSADEKARAERLGLTAKDLERAGQKLATGKAMIAGRKD